MTEYENSTEYGFDRDRFKTIKEACTILDISDSTLKRWRRRAEAKSFKIKKVTYFDIYAVRECMEQHNIAVADNPVPPADPVTGVYMDKMPPKAKIIDTNSTSVDDRQINGDRGTKTTSVNDPHPDKRMAEFQKWMESMMTDINPKMLPGVPETTHKKVKRINFVLILTIIITIAASISIAWNLNTEKLSEKNRADLAEKNVSEQSDKITELQQSKESAIKAEKEKATLIERAAEAEKGLLQAQIETLVLEKDKLNNEMLEAEQRYKQEIVAREDENLLLIKELNDIKMGEKSDKEVDPNSASKDGNDTNSPI